MPETTNQMFIDKEGNHMTRCWSRVKVGRSWRTIMTVVPTDPSQIRSITGFKPFDQSSVKKQPPGQRMTVGPTAGLKSKKL